jgi:hypothetical protein
MANNSTRPISDTHRISNTGTNLGQLETIVSGSSLTLDINLDTPMEGDIELEPDDDPDTDNDFNTNDNPNTDGDSNAGDDHGMGDDLNTDDAPDASADHGMDDDSGTHDTLDTLDTDDDPDMDGGRTSFGTSALAAGSHGSGGGSPMIPPELFLMLIIGTILLLRIFVSRHATRDLNPETGRKGSRKVRAKK